eukprot:jgi/Ulvmu1/10146/UM006_0100.1
MEPASTAANTQPSRLQRSVQGVLRRRMFRKNWVISLFLALLLVSLVVHVPALRRRPRPKATSIWDSAVQARPSAPVASTADSSHPNETIVEDSVTLGDFVNIGIAATSSQWRVEGNASGPSPVCSAGNATTVQRRRKYKRQRPLDVNKWSCGHVAQWLGEQRWQWGELPTYQRRMCKVGVDGAALYHIDEDDLQQDIKVSFRLHRKLILGAIGSLKEQQPVGTAELGSLWQYIHEDPTTAALYVSGVLCTPRLTMLWLHIFEYSTTLGPLLADEDELNTQVAYHAPNTIQEFLMMFPVRANHVLFWIGWLCCPALMVAYHALRCADVNVAVAAYVAAISVGKQFTEWHCITETLLRCEMTVFDKLASWVCSHAMTPALSMLLAVLHLVFAQVMPPWACSALFWLRIFALPPLSIWASWASWVPLPEDATLEDRDDAGFAPVATPRRFSPRGQHAAPGSPEATAQYSGRSDTSLLGQPRFWPPPLTVPAAFEDDLCVPQAFRCPITYEIMREPAIALSGQTYERSAITRWLAGAQERVDPITKAPMSLRHVSPNLALRAVMHDWLRERQVELSRWQWRRLQQPCGETCCAVAAEGATGLRMHRSAAQRHHARAHSGGPPDTLGAPGGYRAQRRNRACGASMSDLNMSAPCLHCMYAAAESSACGYAACMHEAAWVEPQRWRSAGLLTRGRPDPQRRRARSAGAACPAQHPQQCHKDARHGRLPGRAVYWGGLARGYPGRVSTRPAAEHSTAEHSTAVPSTAERSPTTCAAGGMHTDLACCSGPSQRAASMSRAHAMHATHATAEQAVLCTCPGLRSPATSASICSMYAQHARISPVGSPGAARSSGTSSTRFARSASESSLPARCAQPPHAAGTCMHDAWVQRCTSPLGSRSTQRPCSPGGQAQTSTSVARGAWPALEAHPVVSSDTDGFR